MLYTAKATSTTPAFILFLLDVSKSMQKYIPMVREALVESVLEMVNQSTVLVAADRPPQIKPRYYLAFLLYNEGKEQGGDGVQNAYQAIQPNQVPNGIQCPGFLPIEQIAEQVGIPQIHVCRHHTDTALGFRAARELLGKLVPQIHPRWPAPLLCHITDVRFNRGENPKKIVQDIMKLKAPDGAVLVENIFLNEDVLVQPVTEINTWTGVYSEAQLKHQVKGLQYSDDDLRKFELYKTIYEISSPIPRSYFDQIKSRSFLNFHSNAKLLFSGELTSLIKAAIAISTSTGQK